MEDQKEEMKVVSPPIREKNNVTVAVSHHKEEGKL